MKHIGNIPSPYGTMISVYLDRSRSPNADDCYFHDMDGCMDLAGVHGVQREGCRKALKAALGKGGVPFDLFLAHGGQKVPHVAIRPPREPIYLRLPRDDTDIPIESWITLAMDQKNWTRRAEALLGIVDDNRQQSADWDMPGEVRALALQLLLTATLEHMGESEIECLEAAAMYALTVHKDWRAAALKWLTPVQATWFRDWVAARPAYSNFAVDCRKGAPELPSWLVGSVK